MKNIFKLMLLPALVLPLMLTSCDDDHDSNPTLDLSHLDQGFVLNTPGDAAYNTYDLKNSDIVRLTCSQPDYGSDVPYATVYSVEVALDSTFLSDTAAVHKELPTQYRSATLDVTASELNDSIVQLYKDQHPEIAELEEIPDLPVYIRLKAHIYSTTLGYVWSNGITLPSVKANPAPSAQFPATLYISGASVLDGSSSKALATPYGSAFAGQYFTMAYVPDGGTINWGTAASEQLGYSNLTVVDNAEAGVVAGDNDEVKFTKGGWYVLLFVGEKSADGSTINYTLNVDPGDAYVIGAAAGGSWTDGDAAWKLTPPADQNGEWTSPVFTASGELRAYVKLPGVAWWRTEFTLYQGNIFWRAVDIPNNWAEDLGADYSVNCAVGQRLYVNFNTGTGEVR